MTQELQSQGGPLPVAIFVSGVRAPQLAGVQHDPDGIEMHKLGYTEFWKVFQKRYGLNKNLVRVICLCAHNSFNFLS